MQFTALRLVGFKSFVDRTELEIRPGLTGIVGPNGCGKSNLVEALRWVMGETSAKKMRGSGMDDVIFSGTATRPARDIAEVSMLVDNASRAAPAVFNQHEELEITRRINRGSGSDYRVNGKLARAKDVQLLFADSGSGSGSAGMVSQGQIGQLITGRPRDRHRVLEEAAGVSGLHARRHEAELKLRAAEANLERVEDVLVTMANQLKGLKNQARRATRYRNLQQLIRQFEAMSFIHRWQAVEAELLAARAAHEAAEQETRENMAQVARLTTEQTNHAAALPDLRKAEAEAAASLQRIKMETKSLEEEAGRIRGAIAKARERIEQIIRDRGREDALEADARTALERIAADLAAVEAEEKHAPAELATARAESEEAAAALAAQEADIASRTRALAEQSARADSLAAQVAEHLRSGQQAAIRVESLHGQITTARQTLAEDTALSEAEAKLAEAEHSIDQLKAESATADQARSEADKQLGDARRAHDDSFTATTRLQAEIAALDKLVNAQSGKGQQKAPPILQQITVAPGYEKALAAALGDALDAAMDDAAPRFWADLDALPSPDWPAGISPLAAHVTAPPALSRALGFIGLAADLDAATQAQSTLPAGAILTTANGGQWRWDGLVIKPGAPPAAAIRLEQANRLKSLLEEQATAQAQAEQTRTALEAAKQADAEARSTANQARHALNAAYEALNSARSARESIARKRQEAENRLTGLETSLTEATDRQQALADKLQELKQAQAALPDLSAEEQTLAQARTHLAAARSDAEAARDRLSDLTRAAQARVERATSLQAEQQAWQQRISGASDRLQELRNREASTSADLDRLTGRPAEIDANRQALLTKLGELEAAHRQAGDDLAKAESTSREADAALKLAEALLSDSREARAKAESAVQIARSKRAELAERIEDKLGLPPSALPEIAAQADDELPPAHEVQRQLDRLTNEREGMGAVNLLAEEEAQTLGEEITQMEGERDDLQAAINKLRQAIGKLNAEARERLNASFDKVNAEFGRIFTTLFGGGKAHLELVGADDPLEAGLEIYASPPGKRLQVLSLLSGGEQALTALSLLTAVFQSNPAPICVLDEVDAPLDDTNVDRFCQLLDHMVARNNTRFIVITHHRLTMARMNRLYGVTMAEKGVSQLVSVDLGRAERMVS